MRSFAVVLAGVCIPLHWALIAAACLPHSWNRTALWAAGVPLLAAALGGAALLFQELQNRIAGPAIR